VREIEASFDAIELRLPNVPDESVPDGADETANAVAKTWGDPPVFTFAPKPHWELGPELGILDFERAAKITGARFTVLKGAASLLNRALIQFMLDLHTREHGYTELLPPFIVNAASLAGPGSSRSSRRTSSACREPTGTSRQRRRSPSRTSTATRSSRPRRCPSPTAPTPLLPRRGGRGRKDTRGMIRQHQFDKVELVKFTLAEQSDAEHEKLTHNAEAVLERLQLPYRRVLLCRGDLGFASKKTYDLEVWLAGQGLYREISSCSNFGDFQARRAAIRTKVERGGKARNELVHTLNGSGLAVGRTLIAVLENYQRADGSVAVPKALVPYCGGLTEIRKG